MAPKSHPDEATASLQDQTRPQPISKHRSPILPTQAVAQLLIPNHLAAVITKVVSEFLPPLRYRAANPANPSTFTTDVGPCPFLITLGVHRPTPTTRFRKMPNAAVSPSRRNRAFTPIACQVAGGRSLSVTAVFHQSRAKLESEIKYASWHKQ